MNKIIAFLVILFTGDALLIGNDRRIGKLYQQDWESYFALGANAFPYIPSESIPDLSPVGALLSRSGTVGSGTLIASNVVITAAHVIRNSYADNVDPAEWEFMLGSNENWSKSQRKTQVSSILLHPGWEARQNRNNRYGDGDELGVDVALVYLEESIDGLFPARLPEINDDPLGQRVVLAGYGTLVEGINGNRDTSNQRRVGGENTFDRSVPKVFKEGVSDLHLGGLLAIDFDSSSDNHNTLGSGKPILDLLGSGESEVSPLPLEASTAYGDSGGPAFAYTQEDWHIHGVVSYGTKNSRYGDVTVFTRLASHSDWILQNIPDWPSARTIGQDNWRESRWWGVFLPRENGWNYHSLTGWNYVPKQPEDSFWAWNSSIGWGWYSSKVYPFFFDLSSDEWYFLSIEHSKPGSILRYNYKISDWEFVREN